LANRAEKKIRRQSGEKLGEKSRKSRNSRSVSGGGMGAEGVVTNLSIFSGTLNQEQTLKECLYYCTYCAQLGTP